MIEKPTLNQVSSLLDILSRDQHLKGYDWRSEDTWTKLEEITFKQYQFIHHLVFAKKYIQLKGLLDDIQVPRYSHDLSAN